MFVPKLRQKIEVNEKRKAGKPNEVILLHYCFLLAPNRFRDILKTRATFTGYGLITFEAGWRYLQYRHMPAYFFTLYHKPLFLSKRTLFHQLRRTMALFPVFLDIVCCTTTNIIKQGRIHSHSSICIFYQHPLKHFQQLPIITQ